MRDIRNNVKLLDVFSPDSLDFPSPITPGDLVGGGVDISGYDAVGMLFAWAETSDSNFSQTPHMVESDDNVTFTRVASGDLIGSFGTLGGVGSRYGQIMVGYNGTKRYIQLEIEVAVGSPVTGHYTRYATVILTHPHQNPHR